jgi:chromate transport protein ChrA
MITPGPVVITAGFIGYLVAGPWGAMAAAAGVFIPVYLVVLFVSPFFGKIAKNPQARAALQGVTAAATGAIAGAVYILGRRAIHDWATVVIAAVALVRYYFSMESPRATADRGCSSGRGSVVSMTKSSDRSSPILPSFRNAQYSALGG